MRHASSQPMIDPTNKRRITLLIITGIVVYEYRTSQYMGSIRLTNEEPGAMDIGQSDGNGAEST